MSNDKPAPTVAEWFQEPVLDPLDPRKQLRPEYKTDFIVRFHGAAPHGGPALWSTMLRDALKAERPKFYGPPVTPEDERAKIKKMSGAEKLAKANAAGGKK